MLREIASLVAAVSVPVTADIEAGYGDAPAEVALTVQGVLNTGAVGINLEDRTGNGALYAVVDQQRRLDAARASGGNIVINAGTDTYLVSFGITQEERYAETVRRGRAYVEAGADVVFVPGVVESVLARRLVADLGGPVNLMLMPGAPAAGDLLDCGVQRVSTGPAIMLATLGLVARVARELREDGTSARLDEYFYGFSEAEALFTA